MRPILASSLVLCAVACNRGNTASSGGEGGAAPVAVAAASPAAALLDGFEGEIDVNVAVKDSKPGDAPTSLALFVKDNKVRVDIPEKVAMASGNLLGPKAYAIFDSPAKKISIVSDAQKQAIVLDLNKTGEQLKAFKGAGGDPRSVDPAHVVPATRLTKTGKFDTVAGYKCENWDVTSDHREATVCVAQEGASWFSIPMTGIPTERLWMAELFDGKHFPLRLVSYAKDGATEGSRVEVTKIDRKAPAGSLFEYPATYRVVDLGQFFAGMAAMQSGPYMRGMPGMTGMPGMAGMPGMPPSAMPMRPAGPHAKVH